MAAHYSCMHFSGNVVPQVAARDSIAGPATLQTADGGAAAGGKQHEGRAAACPHAVVGHPSGLSGGRREPVQEGFRRSTEGDAGHLAELAGAHAWQEQGGAAHAWHTRACTPEGSCALAFYQDMNRGASGGLEGPRVPAIHTGSCAYQAGWERLHSSSRVRQVTRTAGLQECGAKAGGQAGEPAPGALKGTQPADSPSVPAQAAALDHMHMIHEAT